MIEIPRFNPDEYNVQLATYRSVFPQVSAMLRKVPGVFGAWIGPKIIAGKVTTNLCVTAAVLNKKPDKSVPPEELIPPKLEIETEKGAIEIITDVVEGRRPVFCGRMDTDLPALGGDSISTSGYTGRWGTLGFAAKMNDNDAPGFVTCAHFLGDVNSRVTKPAGFLDMDNQIGTLTIKAPHAFGDFMYLKYDMAFVQVDGLANIVERVWHLDWDHASIDSPWFVPLGDPVRFSGAKSGLQEGKFHAKPADFDGLTIFYEKNGEEKPLFREIHALGLSLFSLKAELGDSGALILWFPHEGSGRYDKSVPRAIGISLVCIKVDLHIEDKWEHFVGGFDLYMGLRDELKARPWNAPPNIFDPPPPPPWHVITGLFLSGKEDPLNTALSDARLRFRESDLGLNAEKWYAELKKVDWVSPFLKDEKYAILATDLPGIGRRLIQHGGKLRKRDLDVIRRTLIAIEEKGVPAPGGFTAEVMARLESAVGKKWAGILEALSRGESSKN